MYKLKMIFIAYSTILVLSSCAKSKVILPTLETKLKKRTTWIFIFAGQSNMAGRAEIEAQDTFTFERIKTLDSNLQLKSAKMPIHYYEGVYNKLDCSMAFAKELIKNIPDGIDILLVPTAVGGSSISQWIADSLHRGVKLLTNFKNNVEKAKMHGEVKGILWHQGENDAFDSIIPFYKSRLEMLFNIMRNIVGKSSLPILIGELGVYSKTQIEWNRINAAIWDYHKGDTNSAVIETKDLEDIGDNIHFNSAAQRELGKRFAKTFLARFVNL